MLRYKGLPSDLFNFKPFSVLLPHGHDPLILFAPISGA